MWKYYQNSSVVDFLIPHFGNTLEIIQRIFLERDLPDQ